MKIENYEPRWGHCPTCGQIVNANPGQSVPPHRAAGENSQCPGTGSSAS